MGTAIKHPVSDRALWRSGLSVRVPGYQKLQMTVWHRMLYSCTHMATVGVEGLTQQTDNDDGWWHWRQLRQCSVHCTRRYRQLTPPKPRNASILSMTRNLRMLSSDNAASNSYRQTDIHQVWTRPSGRPRTTWTKTIHQDLKSNNLSLNEATEVAQNHPLWRLISTFGTTHS